MNKKNSGTISFVQIRPKYQGFLPKQYESTNNSGGVNIWACLRTTEPGPCVERVYTD